MPNKPRAAVADLGATEHQRQTGLRIKAIRELAGLKQAEIADLCGADQSRWSRWERGARPAEIEPMIRFALRASVSLDLIYRGVPGGSHPALVQLLRLAVPELLQPEPEGTAPGTDTALALYRNAIRR